MEALVLDCHSLSRTDVEQHCRGRFLLLLVSSQLFVIIAKTNLTLGKTAYEVFCFFPGGSSSA
jgi:hypothetical protein